jgi:tRNA-(ms[2]io[6]A)-hydroxylase
VLALRFQTDPAWAQIALADLDAFLQDHAANERKVSQSALTLLVQHPDRRELVDALVDVAEEEMVHFRQVYRLLVERGSGLAQDAPDPYMGALRRAIRTNPVDDFLLDRLVLFAIVEARGCERFALLAEALPPGDLKDFYEELVRSEARHHGLYLRLARTYFDAADVDARLDALLDAEAEVMRGLPLRPAMH